MDNAYLMDWIAGVLRESDLLLVSVEWLQEQARSRYPGENLSMKILVERIAGDSRFTLVDCTAGPNNKSGLSVYPKGKALTREINSGFKVMLKERIRDRKEIIRFLIAKADRTYEALKKAWDERMPDDEEAEDRLLEALAKTQRLQRELRTALVGEGAPGDKRSFHNRSA